MTRFHGALLLVLAVVTGAIVLLLVIDEIVQRNAAKRHPPTTEPRPGITNARICPTTENACRRDCEERCWHQE